MDNSGKDISTIVSSDAGDSAEVYAVELMDELNRNLEEEFLTKFRKLTPEQQQKVLDFVDFLVWLDHKRNSNLSDKSEIKNDN